MQVSGFPSSPNNALVDALSNPGLIAEQPFQPLFELLVDDSLTFV
jgi:hypothetical protein